MNTKILMMIFPIVFMIHDFEELCFLESWIRKNANSIRNRFTGSIWIRLEGHSTSALGITIMMMFIFISLTTIISVLLNQYALFAATMMVFTIHNLFHVIQPILLKHYIPAMISAIITLPYSILVLCSFFQQELCTMNEVIVISILYGLILIIYLKIAEKIGFYIDKRINC